MNVKRSPRVITTVLVVVLTLFVFNILVKSFFASSFDPPILASPSLRDLVDAVEGIVEDFIVDHDCAPQLFRIAWLDATTYDSADGTGGPHGDIMTMNHSAPALAGLSATIELLRPVVDHFAAKLSVADVISVAGRTALRALGGASVPWRSGRADSSPHPLYLRSRNDQGPKGTVSAVTLQARHLLSDASVANVESFLARIGVSDPCERAAAVALDEIGRSRPKADTPTARSEPRTKALVKESGAGDGRFFRSLVARWKAYQNKEVELADLSNGGMIEGSETTLMGDPASEKCIRKFARDDDAAVMAIGRMAFKIFNLGLDFDKLRYSGREGGY